MTVVGLGRSAVAASTLLVAHGAEVTVTDRRAASALAEFTARLPAGRVRTVLGGHPPEAFDADLIVISPGVPSTLDPLVRAKAKGTPVISEIELAGRFLTAPIIAITGTNGKSTTTVLVGEMLRAEGRRVFVGGNLGIPLCEAVLGASAWSPWEYVVAEVSSFQLEQIEAFTPRIGAWLNLTPDHLDRYSDLAAYTAAKARLFVNPLSYAVLNADDPAVAACRLHPKTTAVWFSRLHPVRPGVWVEDGAVMEALPSAARSHGPAAVPPPLGQPLWTIRQLRLLGVHNIENALAATLMARLAGCGTPAIRWATETFAGLEHRMEPVGEVGGVCYINDSKGTNVGAVAKTLDGLKGSVVLIAGGRDKGGDFRVLRPHMAERVRVLILIGEARATIRAALHGAVGTIVETGSLEEAVQAAHRHARSGESVLLSPGCASFDMFRDFEDRGRAFKAAVSRLGVRP